MNEKMKRKKEKEYGEIEDTIRWKFEERKKKKEKVEAPGRSSV